MEIKKYIDSDVYTEAKKRIKHVIDIFDNVLVAFSGGKDSLTVLNLVQEVYNELGIKQKVKVFFRDEEVIPDAVIDFVKEKAESGQYDFRYYAIPLQSTKFIMGKTYEYVQWDKDREWVRKPPEYAIRLPENEYRVFDQYNADTFICQNEKGKIAILTGILADESLVRLRSSVNKKNENYINATNDPRIKIVKPIYDWTENDVFLYFFKNKIKYCEIYDAQMLNGQSLRVSTPLHAEQAKRFSKMKTLYPAFYEQIISIFPEMQVQEKYWGQYEKKQAIDGYEHSFDGIRAWVYKNIDDASQRKIALKRIQECETNRLEKAKRGALGSNFGGYPVLYVFKSVQNGQTKRVIQPKKVPTKEEIEYENTKY